jgi:competence protein ComGC/general secretion pathway protein G
VGFSRALPLVVVLFVLWAGSPVAAELHPGLKARACKSNQMVILGAVELYNMNSSRKMSSLDFPALTASESWLREVPECPAQGTYSSRGDLSVDGRIFCSVHGTTEECQAFEDAYQEKQTRHLYQVLAVLGFGVIGFLAFLIFGRSRRPKAQSE